MRCGARTVHRRGWGLEWWCGLRRFWSAEWGNGHEWIAGRKAKRWRWQVSRAECPANVRFRTSSTRLAASLEAAVVVYTVHRAAWRLTRRCSRRSRAAFSCIFCQRVRGFAAERQVVSQQHGWQRNWIGGSNRLFVTNSGISIDFRRVSATAVGVTGGRRFLRRATRRALGRCGRAGWRAGAGRVP